jgi:hypothetical protein
MWILQLNDMRAPKIEMNTIVCKAETKEELQDLLVHELVEPYKEDKWGKTYRKGGPLEWYNPPFSFSGSFGAHLIDIGTEDSWAEDARMSYRESVSEIPDVPVY